MPLLFSTTGEFNTLEAVNLCLTYMREPRIDDLALINTSFAAEKAYANVLQQNRVVQATGWWFNTEVQTLVQNASGIITVDPAINKLELHEDERHRFAFGISIAVEIAADGTRTLRNTAEGTSTFHGPFKVRATKLLPYERTPDAFRRWVAYKAASLSGQEVEEGIGLSPFHQREFEAAEAEVNELELINRPVNFFSNIPQVR